MKDWISQLEELIKKNHMLSHPFYQAWTCGHLSKETLQEYAKEYYHHVKAFPTYLSALHARSDDMEVRKSLLNNLIDEEAGTPNHPDLWRNFALSLGVTQEELDHHTPAPATRALIDQFRKICSNAPLLAGVAALYSYESQIPSICETKIEGLKKWFGMNNPEGYRYFTVHQTADVEHAEEEKALLMKLVRPKEVDAVLESVEKTLTALWNFLSSFKFEKMPSATSA